MSESNQTIQNIRNNLDKRHNGWSSEISYTTHAQTGDINSIIVTIRSSSLKRSGIANVNYSESKNDDPVQEAYELALTRAAAHFID